MKTTGTAASCRADCLYHVIILQLLYNQRQALQRPLHCVPDQTGSLATVSIAWSCDCSHDADRSNTFHC